MTIKKYTAAAIIAVAATGVATGTAVAQPAQPAAPAAVTVTSGMFARTLDGHVIVLKPVAGLTTPISPIAAPAPQQAVWWPEVIGGVIGCIAGGILGVLIFNILGVVGCLPGIALGMLLGANT